MTERALVILRHAKAEPPERYAKDIERPLSARGHRDAAAAGEWLVRHGLSPDLVLCSPAVRTRETWQEVLAALQNEPTVVFDPILYSGGTQDALALVTTTQPDAAQVLLIGHDPTASVLSRLLDPAATEGLRTSGIAVHRFDGAWTDLGKDAAKLTDTHTARG
jgi:phosphohistidine phosphatase